jgi:hypothetical protein
MINFASVLNNFASEHDCDCVDFYFLSYRLILLHLSYVMILSIFPFSLEIVYKLFVKMIQRKEICSHCLCLILEDL